MPSGHPEQRSSYLLSVFNRWDWGIVLVLAGLFVGAAWFAVERTIAAETAEVRASITLLQDEIADSTTDLGNRMDALDADLSASFDQAVGSMQQTVQEAMQQRTDELSRTLTAQFNAEKILTVHVTNVPLDDTAAIQLVQGFLANHGSETLVMPFGNKLQWTAQIEDLQGVAARDLQTVLEELQATNPEVETVLTYDEKTLEILPVE